MAEKRGSTMAQSHDVKSTSIGVHSNSAATPKTARTTKTASTHWRSVSAGLILR
jgi:hypothetical protein